MAIYKLVLPKMGESVSEATITNWLIEVGGRIEEDDAVVEIATDKVDSEVPSPVSGILKERLFESNQVVQVGQALALIEVDGDEELPDSGFQDLAAGQVEAPVVHTPEIAPVDTPEELSAIPGISALSETKSPVVPSEQATHTGIRFYSPLVRNIAREEGISQAELDSIVGTGAEGRVTKDDMIGYLAQRAKSPKVSSAEEQNPRPLENQILGSGAEVNVSQPAAQSSTLEAGAQLMGSAGDEIIEMDRMRRLIADHMSHSVKTSPHVFSVVEADVTNLVNWRNKIKADYKRKEGENITFTPLFIEAISKALQDFPMINVSVDGYSIIKKKSINIGMATALPSGNLIVPVIKGVDQLSLTGITRAVNDFAQRARAGKLKPDDTQGGTFTFTNIGAFGNIFGMPIINQPQAAILAVGTIKKKPAVIETDEGDVIAVRHMMYISMSYDHRVIDGALGGQFIRRVADYLENWDKQRKI